VQIYLLRHGIAENAPHGKPDSERALTDEGREKLRRVLGRARAADVVPSLILSSPYRRAMETADVAVEVLGYQGKVVKTRALVPEASPFDTWEEIRKRPDESAILLASHEPLMSTLAGQSGALRRHEEGRAGAHRLRPPRAGTKRCAQMDADPRDLVTRYEYQEGY
jgi:phosphohistidine phosphatase